MFIGVAACRFELAPSAFQERMLMGDNTTTATAHEAIEVPLSQIGSLGHNHCSLALATPQLQTSLGAQEPVQNRDTSLHDALRVSQQCYSRDLPQPMQLPSPQVGPSPVGSRGGDANETHKMDTEVCFLTSPEATMPSRRSYTRLPMHTPESVRSSSSSHADSRSCSIWEDNPAHVTPTTAAGKPANPKAVATPAKLFRRRPHDIEEEARVWARASHFLQPAASTSTEGSLMSAFTQMLRAIATCFGLELEVGCAAQAAPSIQTTNDCVAMASPRTFAHLAVRSPPMAESIHTPSQPTVGRVSVCARSTPATTTASTSISSRRATSTFSTYSPTPSSRISQRGSAASARLQEDERLLPKEEQRYMLNHFDKTFRTQAAIEIMRRQDLVRRQVGACPPELLTPLAIPAKLGSIQPKGKLLSK